MHDDCLLTKVAFALWGPIDLLWSWITANRDERDIEEQRRELERLAALDRAAKMEPTHDDPLGGPQ